MILKRKFCSSKTAFGVFTAAFRLATWFLIAAGPHDIRCLSPVEHETYGLSLYQAWRGNADADGQETELFAWSEV
ncbi:hypothetical protein BDW22DRAFT_1353584 [Trametopsis cervina]|nr:hypothetical protein BDW22DRAFT_1353584 [Trametopsis cervina]